METTEKIVESYVRYVRGWATIPNIKCDKQKEIDLFAIDPLSGAKYHIETSVSISQSFRSLTAKPYELGDHKIRGKAASARRTLGFFLSEKFDALAVQRKLAELGGADAQKIIVVWQWDPGLEEVAAGHGIELWDFRELMREVSELGRNVRTYFGDDTIRTLMLFVKATNDRKIVAAKPEAPRPAAESPPGPDRFWIYINRIHNYAKLHRSSCTYCQDGAGLQNKGGGKNGQWRGPYGALEEAREALSATGKSSHGACRCV